MCASDKYDNRRKVWFDKIAKFLSTLLVSFLEDKCLRFFVSQKTYAKSMEIHYVSKCFKTQDMHLQNQTFFFLFFFYFYQV